MKSEDVNKLHSETLQLRNQQFQIVTLALASTGISAWLIPAISSGDEVFDNKVILIASGSWMFLLANFFSWSLSLKRLIDVIGIYLKMNNFSDWEGAFNQFHKTSKIHLGQTKFSLLIFWSYGVIVTISGAIAVNKLEWQLSLGIIGLIYIVFCFLKYWFNSQPKRIEEKWKEILKKTNINP